MLSACQTGLGEVMPGQGVLGLRRGFATAGVQSLIMTLWSIEDETTADLMDEMYRLHLQKGLAPSDALRGAQLEALKRQRRAGEVRPYGWAAFISSGQ